MKRTLLLTLALYFLAIAAVYPLCRIDYKTKNKEKVAFTFIKNGIIAYMETKGFRNANTGEDFQLAFEDLEKTTNNNIVNIKFNIILRKAAAGNGKELHRGTISFSYNITQPRDEIQKITRDHPEIIENFRTQAANAGTNGDAKKELEFYSAGVLCYNQIIAFLQAARKLENCNECKNLLECLPE